MDEAANAINSICYQIAPLDESWRAAARERQLTLTKPPLSLGRLEEIANRIAAIQQANTPRLAKKRIYVVAGDHGVTVEGVSAYPSEVTAQMVYNFLSGGAAINVLARHGDIEVKVVDASVDADLSGRKELISVKTMNGTANFARGPAMSRTDTEAYVTAGVELARAAKADRVDLLGVGEMGIGNTTSASAITAALTGQDPASLTDRGTGVDAAGVAHKTEIIRRALTVNQPDPGDAIDILAKVGGAEIAVMTGIIIGAAVEKIPVVADGFISTAAAALAVALFPNTRGYLFLAHRSVEQGHIALINFIGMQPLLDLGMRLGEGTGAALAMHLIDASAKLLCEMATFAEAAVSGKK